MDDYHIIHVGSDFRIFLFYLHFLGHSSTMMHIYVCIRTHVFHLLIGIDSAHSTLFMEWFFEGACHLPCPDAVMQLQLP